MSSMLKPSWDVDLYSVSYDLVICALGYETRCRYAAERYVQQCENAKKIALSFSLNNCLAYPENKSFFEGLDYEVVLCSDEELESALSTKFKTIFSDGCSKKILVDISSFSRFRLSKILELFYLLAPDNSEVYFNYTVAEFELPKESFTPITNLSPLSNFFAGSPSSPSKSLTCIMGLGYEEDRAIGALEFLEIGEAIIFKPISIDGQYDTAVNNANSILLADMPKENIIQYEMGAPSRIYSLIDATVKGLKPASRVIAIPLGPKVFALVSLLVSINNRPDMPIWSVSSVNDSPFDRKSSGKTIVFSAVKCSA